MVLASDKGWPYSWKTIQDPPKDVFVNCEVERLWQTVKGDLTAWFSPHGGTDFTPERRVLIGTPGIGKSMNAGSYLLYQLLHYDVEKLQVVVHCFGGGDAYVFDKTIKTVTRYVGRGASKEFVPAFGDEWVCYLRCDKARDTARRRFCALCWMGHDCGVIAKRAQPR
ncbi:putative retrotransposon hot spot protein (RHS) [Trypanosoma cruzi]|uniref:Putative retrotransposon hot spot protein (RHS) n=1 Tax=Trypanosoma cruzi TaxID=5693 RepID=A0A2V2XB07_TRYCR|nr:putative retrotransposon hot spot protein (RHS) [Trypanosoma cruzi]